MPNETNIYGSTDRNGQAAQALTKYVQAILKDILGNSVAVLVRHTSIKNPKGNKGFMAKLLKAAIRTRTQELVAGEINALNFSLPPTDQTC